MNISNISCLGNDPEKTFYATTYPQAVMCESMLRDVYIGKNRDRNISQYKIHVESHEIFDFENVGNHVYGYRITVTVNPNNLMDIGFEITDVFIWDKPAEFRINESRGGQSGYHFHDVFVTGRSANEAVLNAKELIIRQYMPDEEENDDE